MRALLCCVAWVTLACSSAVGPDSGGNVPGGVIPGANTPPAGGAGAGAMGAAGASPVNVDPLLVTAVNPLDGSEGVERELSVAATFSELLDPATVTPASFQVTAPAGAVEGTIAVEGATATFTPTTPLALLAPLTVTLAAGILGLEGSVLAEPYEFSFRVRDGAFGEPVQLTMGAAVGLEIAGNTAGDLVAVWSDVEVTSSIHAAVFDGETSQWAEPQLVETDEETAFSKPSVAISESGEALVAWAGGGWNRYRDGWEMARLDDISEQRRLAFTDTGAVTVWDDDGEVVFGVLGAADEVWSEAESLAPDTKLRWLEYGGAGVLAVYSDTDSDSLLVSQYDAQGWSAPEELSEGGDDGVLAAQAHTAPLGDSALVTWSEGESLWASVFAAGAWTPAAELGPGSLWSDGAISGQGALATWFNDGQIMATIYSDAAGWSAPEMLGEGAQFAPAPMLDASGNAMVAWAELGGIAWRRYIPEQGWGETQRIASRVTSSLWGHIDAQGRIALIWRNGRGTWTGLFE